MAKIEARLSKMGLQLPQPLHVPAGLRLPFEWVRVRGGRAFVSGQVPLDADGRLAAPLGKVGAEVSPEQVSATQTRREIFRMKRAELIRHRSHVVQRWSWDSSCLTSSRRPKRRNALPR
jgi:enamine deaminase RidA (YjgF/YER057c/UK114 family)